MIYLLVVEVGDGVLRRRFLLKRNFGGDRRVLRRHPAVENLSGYGLDGRLDIRGCGARREIAPDDDERPRTGTLDGESGRLTTNGSLSIRGVQGGEETVFVRTALIVGSAIRRCAGYGGRRGRGVLLGFRNCGGRALGVVR